MNVLLTGAGGMLARAFLNKTPRHWNLRALDRATLDVTDPQTVEAAMRQWKPALVLNCAALTRVDDCESQRAQAEAVNGLGAGHIAQACSAIGAQMVHFSTDYIFDGAGHLPYAEDDPVCPINVYGASKWDGECRVRAALAAHLIVRTQWLYGRGGSHFVKTILALAEKQETIRVVNDQIGAPTWTEDLSEATLTLIEAGATGTYHLVNVGACSWYDFARKIIQEAGLSTQVIPCTTSEFPRPARRPAHAVLSTEKAKRVLGRALPPWDMALRRFIRSV